MSNVLSIPPYLGGNMSNRPYSTNVLDHVPATLKARAAKWPLLGAEVELPYLVMRTAGERLNGAAIVKDDATIPDDGGEVVFHPMTYKQLRTRFASLADDTGCLASSFVAGCGTHIHLSPAWGIQPYDMKEAFNAIPSDTLDALAGRGETEYSRRRGSVASHTSAVSYSEKYGTIEVRHAQGMTSAYRLGAWLDTVYNLAKRLRKGDMPSTAASYVLANPTADMARVIADGAPYLEEVEDDTRYCEGCGSDRDEDQFVCGDCDTCDRCCDCKHCNDCGNGGPDTELCDDCDVCVNCCMCVRCENCGTVDDSVGDCDHDDHDNYCGDCCRRNTCNTCDEPTDYSATRDHSTNYRTYCSVCAVPVVTAYNVARDARLAVAHAVDAAFIGPRRVKMSQLSWAQLGARGLQGSNAFAETDTGWWEYVYLAHIVGENGGDN